MGIVIGLDVGTSGVKAVAFNADGLAGTAFVEYGLQSPRPGWMEQDPEEIWQGTIRVLRQLQQLLQAGEVRPADIQGISFSGQMHSAVFLDANREVIRPAILWNDTRTTAQCRKIEELVGRETLLAEACNPALEGFTAPKLLWLRKHEPEHFRKLRYLLLVKDYIRMRLTGEIHMELSDAAGTLLLNVKQASWSSVIMNRLALPMEILPPLVKSAAVTGVVSDEAAAETSLQKGIPVVAGGADNACGALGGGIVCAGRAMVSLGTSGVVLAHLEQPSLPEEGTIHMFNSALPDRFYMMGVVLSAGLSYRWVRDIVGSDEVLLSQKTGQDVYALLNELASESQPGSRGLVFLPYLTGERTPHGDGSARGAFVGLTAGHTRQEVVRSVMEGVAYAFRDCTCLLREAGWEGDTLRAIGGGAKSRLWRQIIASVTGCAIASINHDEGPAMGAALLAGVGTGMFTGLAEAADQFTWITDTTHPIPEWQPKYEELYGVYRELYPALKSSFWRLARWTDG